MAVWLMIPYRTIRYRYLSLFFLALFPLFLFSSSSLPLLLFSLSLSLFLSLLSPPILSLLLKGESFCLFFRSLSLSLSLSMTGLFYSTYILFSIIVKTFPSLTGLVCSTSNPSSNSTLNLVLCSYNFTHHSIWLLRESTRNLLTWAGKKFTILSVFILFAIAGC